MRLGVEPEDLELVPKVSDMIADALGRTKGGFPRNEFLNYLSASKSEEAKAFLKTYREVPQRDRASLSVEAICVAAEVSPLAIVGALFDGVKDMNKMRSALKAMVAHPDVVQATIDSATKGTPLVIAGKVQVDKDKKPILIGGGDVAAQKLMHEAIGFLPTKQGSQLTVNLLGATKHTSDDEDTNDADEAFDAAFGSPGEIAGQLESWGEQRRALTDGR